MSSVRDKVYGLIVNAIVNVKHEYRAACLFCYRKCNFSLFEFFDGCSVVMISAESRRLSTESRRLSCLKKNIKTNEGGGGCRYSQMFMYSQIIVKPSLMGNPFIQFVQKT